MKYIVELNGERREVELEGPTARIGEREVAVNLETIEGMGGMVEAIVHPCSDLVDPFGDACFRGFEHDQARLTIDHRCPA